jgi:hypothetical protein
MGDFNEVYEAMRKDRQEKHAEWKRLNTQILEKSGLVYMVAGPETFIFREEGKPKVDFYPSTGRWRELSSGRTFRGGATAFISWYKKL